MKLIARLTINIFALFIVSYIIPGFSFTNLQSLVVASVVIGVVNTFIKPLLQLIALPLTLLTFGLAAFFINVSLLWFVATIVPGFEIESFFTALVASITLSLVSWFLHRLASE